MTQETEHLVRFSFLFLLLKILSTNSIFCQEYPDVLVDSILKSGIRHIISQNYSSAETDFKQLDNEYPQLPLGKIYLAACSIAESFDFAEEYNTEYIESSLDEAKEIIGELLSKDENNLWNIYFYALAEGYISYYEALNKNWLTSLSKGLNSISAFEQCLDINDKFYESYIAIGTFEYWKSRKTEFVSFMPFYEDDTEAGIDNLRVASKLASYNSYLAINSLIWIYIDQNDFHSAIELGEEAVAEFPYSRYFKKGLARSYEEVDPQKSIELYKDILNSYPSNRKQNRINSVKLNHKIAQQYAAMGESKKALELCKQILSIKNLSEFETSKLSRRIGRVNELKNSLSE
ncbi:MAG: tetratricopeptide repeat protein [Ignavibacterium sp.]|nr:MAG: tetratricopeptide repeat protein [Ignavibacterium sp.]